MTVDTATPPARTESRSRRSRSFKPRYPAWLLLPSLIYLFLFFVCAMAILVVFSFATQVGFSKIHYGFSLENYKAVLDPTYISIFFRTLVMASVGTILTILIGYPLAYWMARYLSGNKLLALLLVIVPFWTSFLIRTYALKIILDSNGYFAKVTHLDLMYSGWAVMIGLVYNYLPLFVLPVFASLERMDWTLIEAANDLTAKPIAAFRQITLPLTLPGFVTGALLVFIPMTGEYVIPGILGGGKFEFVGNVIGDAFGSAQNAPFGSALAMSLMIALSVFVVIYIVVATKEERFGS